MPRGTKVAFHPVERSWRRSADPKRGSAGPVVAPGAILPDPDVQHPEVLVMTNYISLRAVWHALKERGYWRMCAAMSTDHPVPVSPNRRCL